MTERGQRSIVKIRTFSGDVSRARAASATPTATATTEVPSPLVGVTPTPKAVPSAPQTVTPVAPSIPPSVPHTTTAVTSLNHETPVTPETLPQPARPLVHAREIPVPAARTLYDTTLTDDAFAEEGTIVSNKRTRQFKLIPAIVEALAGWTQAIPSRLRKTAPTPVVPTAESRLDTLREAAKASHHVPQDDHGMLIKRISTPRPESVPPKVHIKAASEIAAPHWTHVSSVTPLEGGPLPERTRPTPVQSTADTMTNEAPSAPAVAVAQSRNHVTSLEQDVASVPQPLHTYTAPVITTPAPTFHYTPTPPVVATRPVVSAPIQSVPVSPITRTVVSQPTVAPSPEVTKSQPNQNRIIITFILIIIGASLLGIGTTVLWYLHTNTTRTVAVVPTTDVPTNIITTTRTAVALQTTRIATLDAILNAVLARTETQHIYLTTVDTSGASVPADTTHVFTTLGFRLPGNFTRNVRTLSFGGYAGTDPFIVMQSNDFSTAFAGMLAWETNMSADLAPLFGPVVSESFDPTARTATQVRPAFFRDTIIANLSARILVNPANEARIVYGFVAPNLILITQNETAFSAIAPLLTPAP